jgi:CheY-like chemotaxis protein
VTPEPEPAPAAAGAPNGPAAENPPPRPVLIVDDHAATTKVMVRLVEARGFRVLTAHSLAEARAVAAAHDIGFLISDLGLPDGNGGDLMKELHDRLGIVGAALTGYGMDADVLHAKSMGFVMHLTKPIQIHDLEKVLAVARQELAARRPGQ